MYLALLSLFGILLQTVSGNTSSCSLEDLRTCRSKALDEMSGIGGKDAVQQERQCKDLRENFDCMLWQTSMCFKKEDQDSNSDVILKTWRNLESFCEKYGNWWASPCFQRDDVKRCESVLPSKRNTLDNQSCRLFVSFRDCVRTIAESACSSSDRSLLGTYFMEKGQQMAWRCPKDADYSSMTAESAQQVDRRYPEMYGDSSSDMCQFQARSELDTCNTKFQSAQSEANRRDDSDMRNHKLCCELVDMEQCITDAIKKKCSVSDLSLVESLMSDSKKGLEPTCKAFSEEKCNEGGSNSSSSSSSILPGKAAGIYFLLYLVYFIYVKKF